MRNRILFSLLVVAAISIFNQSEAQSPLKNDVIPRNGSLLTDMIDTNTIMGRNMLSIYTRYGNINFSSYVQFQYQYASDKGISSFAGGDFAPNSDNRFRMRRARLRTDYTHYNPDGKISTYFVFQFDATDRGVNVRDCWGRYYENKFEMFHVTAGIMARPFGYELLYSSQNRESPERGRMSQTIMNTERDMGAMLSYSNRRKNAKLKALNVDFGVYNGQGLTGNNEYDSHKDMIGKITLKRVPITKNKKVYLSGGISTLYGGMVNNQNTYGKFNKGNMSLVDTNAANIGKIMPRHYYGVDAQLLIKNKVGYSEFRAEYITGVQTATQVTSATPGYYPVSGTTNIPFYQRNFNGAYFWYLQNLGSNKHQLVLKYDWYDPNSDVKGLGIDAAKGFSAADVKYQTLGIGYVYYINPHLKMFFYYDNPINEKTSLNNFKKDLSDNVFTCRAQFSF